jgi:hypothetical protein
MYSLWLNTIIQFCGNPSPLTGGSPTILEDIGAPEVWEGGRGNIEVV